LSLRLSSFGFQLLTFSFQLYHPHQPEEPKGDEVEEHELKDRQIQRDEYRDNRKDKECFVMNSRQQPLGKQHQDDKDKKGLGVKPVERPVKKHRQPHEHSGQDEKDFFGIKIKRS